MVDLIKSLLWLKRSLGWMVPRKGPPKSEITPLPATGFCRPATAYFWQCTVDLTVILAYALQQKAVYENLLQRPPRVHWYVCMYCTVNWRLTSYTVPPGFQTLTWYLRCRNRAMLRWHIARHRTSQDGAPVAGRFVIYPTSYEERCALTGTSGCSRKTCWLGWQTCHKWPTTLGATCGAQRTSFAEDCEMLRRELTAPWAGHCQSSSEILS